MRDLLEYCLIIPWRRLEAAAHMKPHLAEEFAEIFELIWIRPFVNAVQRRQLRTLEQQGCGHVRAQHTLLDQLVGIVAVNRHDLGDFAILTKDNARLGCIEVHRAIGLARLAKRMKQPVKTG